MNHHCVACLCGNSSLKSATIEAGARDSLLEILSLAYPHACPPPLAKAVSFRKVGIGKGRGDIASSFLAATSSLPSKEHPTFSESGSLYEPAALNRFMSLWPRCEMCVSFLSDIINLKCHH